MKNFIQNISIQMPIGNLYRKNHVLLVIKTQDNSYLFGKKTNFYPSGIARMFGGGMEQGEEPIFAAKRELFEETGVSCDISQICPVCSILTNASTDLGQMNMVTYVYFVDVSKDAVIPSDDVDGILELKPDELSNFVKQIYGLDGKYETPDFWFNWSDWGKIYGFIHEKAFRSLGILV